MSDDWPKGWYRDEKPSGTNPASDATHDMTVAVPPAGAGGAPWTPGAGGQGGGGYGSASFGSEGLGTPGAETRSGWPAQPPRVSGSPGYAPPGSPGYAPPGSPGYAPPTSPGYAPPGRVYKSGRRWRFWGQPGRRGRRIALIAGSLVVVLIAALAGSYFWLDGKLNRSVALPAFAGQSAGTNWLIVGSDGRDGLTTKQIIQYHVGFDFGTANSDSLMLLHMGSGRPVLISIPRDSYVPIPGYGENKINAALGLGGPTLLIKTVESVTGLRIDHYMGIGFAGLVSVVNTIGGVRICLPTAINDSTYSGLNLSAGCHNLNGTQALAFVRDRHSFAISDLQRIQDQRAFLKAMLDKTTSPGVYLNPFAAVPFASTAASSIAVDKGTSLYDLLQAAMALRNPETGTVPIANPALLTSNAGEAVQWNQSEALALFNALKNGKPVPAGLLSGTQVG